MLNLTDDYDNFNNCTKIEIENINIIVKFLLLSIPSIILLLCLIG